ncbi:MAG: hypothetical protein IKA78_02155 [Oscillospiraceae bacterium]|nr:hypothetical protein [Oscillospiraceae bacterium]
MTIVGMGIAHPTARDLFRLAARATFPRGEGFLPAGGSDREAMRRRIIDGGRGIVL